jgi:hypothetical protein
MIRHHKTFKHESDCWLSILEMLNAILPVHQRLTMKQQDIMVFMLQNYPNDYNFRKKGNVDDIRAYFRMDKPCFSMHLSNMHSKEWMVDGMIAPAVLKFKDQFPDVKISIILKYEPTNGQKRARANHKQSS